jgi:hypothetical protein
MFVPQNYDERGRELLIWAYGALFGQVSIGLWIVFWMER